MSVQMNNPLRITSWNVNGVLKLRSFFGRPRETVVCPDVLFLQETWANADGEQFLIKGYVAHHAPALPSSGHNVCGVSSYFRLEVFSGGVIQRLNAPVPWVLTVRWERPDGSGVVFVNVYAAIYTTGVLASDFDLLCDYVSDL
jgi:exonuclease III